MPKISQKAAMRRMFAAAAVVATGTLAVRGFLLPWSEEGAVFALYGAAVGFSLAILCNMALMWLMRRR